MAEKWDDLSSNVIRMEPIGALDRMFLRTFSTEAGQRVLDYLRRATYLQPTWYPGEEASHGYAREGQNSIVREIEKRIDRARSKNE